MALGDENSIYVSNDWHTGLLPVYLRAFYQDHFKLSHARWYIVHNIATRAGPTPKRSGASVFPSSTLAAASTQDDPMEGPCMNIMKAAINYATKVIAVIGYARELGTDEGGYLAPTVRSDPAKVSGIVNGIALPRLGPLARSLSCSPMDSRPTGSTSRVFGRASSKAALHRDRSACPSATTRA